MDCGCMFSIHQTYFSMKKTILFIGACLLSAFNSVTAQIYYQNFEGPASRILNYVNTDSSQLNDAGPVASGGSDGASVVNNHGSKKLQMVRSSTNSFFSRKFIGFDVNKNNMYGALIGGLDNPAYVLRPQVARSLGILYMRDALNLNNRSTWTNEMADSGFKMAITINWRKTSVAEPFPTDTVAFKDSMDAALSYAGGIIPAVIFLENEENNTGDGYHTGYAATYLNELRAATGLAHAYGYKIGNGGATANVMRYLTYHYYADDTSQGYNTTKAASFLARTPNTNYNNANLKARGRFEDTVLRALATIPVDYVNYHWYGGTSPDGKVDVMQECVEYLRAITGKTVVTNEIGQYNTDTATTDSLLKATKDLELPIVMWYDNDGSPALALNETNGTLRANGIAFKNYLATNKLGYNAPKFISVSFNLRDTLSTTQTSTGNTFSIGHLFTNDDNTDPSGNVHSQIIIYNTNDGRFRIKDPTSSNLYPVSSSQGLLGEQNIKWYINNSGATQTYNGPDGSSHNLADGKWDIYVKAASGSTWTKAFTASKSALNAGVPLEDMKFIFNTGAATMFFDDIKIYDEISQPSAKSFPGVSIATTPEDDDLRVSCPAGNNIRLFASLQEENDATITIYDVNGRVIASQKTHFTAGLNILDMPACIVPGIYVATIRTSSVALMSKFNKVD